MNSDCFRVKTPILFMICQFDTHLESTCILVSLLSFFFALKFFQIAKKCATTDELSGRVACRSRGPWFLSCR